MTAAAFTPARAAPDRDACRVCGDLKTTTGTRPLTYVVQRGKYLKVGSTYDLRRQLAALRLTMTDASTPDDFNTQSKFVLLGTTLGPVHDVHEALAPYHVAGEWFEGSPTLRRALRDLLGVRL